MALARLLKFDIFGPFWSIWSECKISVFFQKLSGTVGRGKGESYGPGQTFKIRYFWALLEHLERMQGFGFL